MKPVAPKKKKPTNPLDELIVDKMAKFHAVRHELVQAEASPIVQEGDDLEHGE